jgi:hypothetical protein
MKKPQLKYLRQVAAKMVAEGAPATQTLNYVTQTGKIVRKVQVPINHARRMKRLVTRNKLTIGQAIDRHVGKYFTLKDNG